MRVFIQLIALFIMASGGLRGQGLLRGRVSDGKTGQGLSQANLFFPELKRGTATLDDGSFSVRLPIRARALLQVSHVGYENFFVVLDLATDSLLNVTLTPSVIQMKDVVVTGPLTQPPAETIFNIAQFTKSDFVTSGALNISDGVARLPGVSQLTTGPGISKPVIRGLYGNRIQVNVNGIRFDNQQWQDEHGLGLSDMGVDRVEIIRGPASLLYGSDALGGVLNVIEERPAVADSEEQDLSARIYSNTYGLSLNYGHKKTLGNRWRKFRAGLDSHADYSDGKGNRVLNSRFASYNAKFGWGRYRDKSVHAWNVAGSFSEFGFVADSISSKLVDSRVSRSFDGPHHVVGFGQVNSENTYYKGDRQTKLNAGFISNLRMEDEGGGGISLSMLLNTLNVTGQVTRPSGKNGELTYGSGAMFQTNKNLGNRIIVPDAITGEGSVYLLEKRRFNKFLAEGGARFDLRFIETFATKTLNVPGNGGPTQEILPFSNFYNAFNLSLGFVYTPVERLNVKVNGSTGYRPGNLAELSSNGLHEGTLRWEIGLPDAKIEQNFNIEGTVSYTQPQFSISASVYQNNFINYFYLNPTGNEYYGFKIYKYQQSDARFQGGECTVNWNPRGSTIDLNGALSLITAQKSDGSYLPFVPANKLSGGVTIHLRSSGTFTLPAVNLGGVYVAEQNRPAQFETETPAYFLLNASFTTQWKKISFSVACNNLADKYYFDHLSRFKYYGIANMGRNIVLGMNFKI